MTSKKINADQLSPKALSLVSEFALVLYRLNGTIINVDSRDVLVKVIANARVAKDQRLLNVYSELKRELSNNFLSSVSDSTAVRLKELTANQLTAAR